MKAAFSILGAIALAACVDATQPTGIGPIKGNVAALPPGSPVAGSQVVSGEAAFKNFQDVCLKNLPRFIGARTALARMPFSYVPGTDVYAHKNLNLSFKIVQGKNQVCSMIFGSRDDPRQMSGIFGIAGSIAVGTGVFVADSTRTTTSASAPNGASFVFEPIGKSGGLPFYHVYLVAGS